LGISVDIRKIRIRNIAPAILTSPMALEWDFSVQRKLDRKEISEEEEGIYIWDDQTLSEENFPRDFSQKSERRTQKNEEN
jgi:hypothetical protein